MIDLSRLNTFLLLERFEMETPESLDRPIRCLFSHPHRPKLKEVTKVLPHDCKGSEADGPNKGSQTQKEAQVNDQTVVGLTESLGCIINREKSKLKPTQVFLFVGYKYHLDSALVKPTKERLLKLQDLTLRLKSKHVLITRCLMLLIGLLASTPPKGGLKISSVIRHPPSLVSDHFSSPRVVEGWSAHLEQVSTKGLLSDREKRLHLMF